MDAHDMYNFNSDVNRPVTITKSDLPPATDDFPPHHFHIPETAVTASSFSLRQQGAPTRHTMRRLILKIAVPLVIAIVVIASVTGTQLSKKNNNNEDSGSGSISTGDEPPQSGDGDNYQYAGGETVVPQQTPQFLPMPPDDLGITCDPNNIATAAGRRACQIECQVAACCEFPSDLPLSCVVENQDVCVIYHSYCVSLNMIVTSDPTDTTDNLPPADANINIYCAPESLSTIEGMQACYQVCEPAKCCYVDQDNDDTVDTTSCATDPECEAYSACLYLGVSDTINSDITLMINEKCSDDRLTTESGRTVCETACAQALCCLDDLTTCIQVQGGTEEDLQKYCSQYEKCHDVWKYQAEDNPYDGSNLYPTRSPVTESVDKSQIDEYCYHLDDETSRTICVTLCKPASCCMSDPFQCSTDINCDDYLACYSLSGYDPQPDPTYDPQGTDSEKHEMDHYCNELEFDASRSRCEMICQFGACCYLSPDVDNYDAICPYGISNTTVLPDTSTNSVKDCNDYQACSNLASFDTETAVTPSKQEVVSNFCSDLQFDYSFSYCQDLCANARCCMEGALQCPDGVSNTTVLDDGRVVTVDCYDYAACQNLINQ